MSLEHHPARSDSVAGVSDASDYWDAFIDEKLAAEFLDLTARTLQGWRQKGGGPRYTALSNRCVRYTRRWLRQYAEARLRTSTADPGNGAS